MQPTSKPTQAKSADRAAAERWARSLARARKARVQKPVTFDQFAFNTLFQKKAA